MAEKIWTETALRESFRQYVAEINASGRTNTTKATYIVHAERFLRYMLGQVTL